ncbi:venom allergen 5-like [Diabrotica virgifera virgifera]|uniref:Venom allergen 5-like n=1 Tax=Diabrotica virgifera virgifera TaxID=50390 RepID=A0A6P7H2V4_DIAVI|nr:venom allergen 5-like [Diabrotica virgifera virgifera]
MMIKIIKILVLFSVVLVIEADFDYCSLTCDHGKFQHTVCIRKKEQCGKGPKCHPSFRQVALTDKMRRIILDRHNALRNKVATGQEKIGNQPSASNMRALSWSRELEYIAQCWTNNCQYKHDDCRRTKKWGGVGQNVAIQSTYNFVFKDLDAFERSIKAWYSEVKIFNSSMLPRYESKGETIQHYTQLVWAKTDNVGCAATFYKNSTGWNFHLIACNYGPTGNYKYNSVYKQGPPVSDCGKLPVNKKYRGLCGPDNL